ncbi:MAG: hypothetical protein KJ583_07615 [Nanoarchaeota archaeon]|nr:hypothetical protein [Nanoarchaeota archaeon]MBU1269846.1 hypothetical protein [Nanoarchaeota archaeon]MBU1605155.1 hypothetical protein [Nanoarchaeota archaeon]MBU2442969.1 hypothetical protein [Nanoarchaeota archaeon]
MFKKYYVIAILAILILSATGCQYLKSEEQIITGEVIEIGSTNTTIIEIKTDNETKPVKEENKTKEETFSKNIIKIEKVEGDLISLKPDAYDPDGDKVIYTFTEPFNKEGLWKTKEGDTGEYKVTITASDGKLSTSEEILVIVKPTNKPPIIQCPDEFKFKETDLINIDCKIYDLEGEEVLVKYSGWMSSSKYQSKYGDEGEHKVLISTQDKQNKTSQKEVIIKIEKLNRAPVVQDIKTITIEETETAQVIVNATDSDDDKLTIKYSEPLNSKGVWQTKLGDAGTYNTFAVVSDSESSVKKEFKIVVTQKNTAPTIKYIEPITVDEGDTITLPIDAVDREGDKLSVKIVGWMKTDKYTTTYDDAGKYTVIITVSDGVLSTSQTVNITVNNVNRAPVFKVPA